MKTPQVNETVNIKKGVNPAQIIAVYDGSNVQGKRTVYSVKVASGDIYDVVRDGLKWQAIN